MERFENIKTSIDNADNIKLLFPENPEAECLSSVLALYFALKKMGKNVFIPIERLPNNILSSIGIERKQISITFGKETSEVYYDKEPNGLKLTIIPKNSDFSLDNLSVKINVEKTNFDVKELDSFELVISIGIQKFEQVDKLLMASEEELFDCTIINIDNNLTNENYGDINIVENNVSILKIISLIIKQVGEKSYNKESMDFLIYGFFSQERLKQENIPIIKWLIKNNGDFDLYYSQEKLVKPAWINDFKEIIRNSVASKDKKNIYSYLNPDKDIIENFEEKIRNILSVSKVFHEWINPSSFFIAFYDPKENMTKVIFYSSEQSIIETMRNQHAGMYKESGGIIYLKETTPKESIEIIKSSLE
ncbi:MAG: hypothetical protein PHW52_00120 [Candidatus Pacebacteria bacterium]|nr:hypothetical protein [Candidatus Paceibacterota bacterium]